MKTTLAVIALTLTFGTTSFASTNLAELNLKIHNVITFKKLDNLDSYEKLNEVTHSEASITANNETKTDIKKNVNTDKLSYSINKGLILVQDAKANINAEVPVQVEKSIFGKIKSFKISGQNIENLYYESLKRSGVVALSEIDLKKNERKSLVIGDQECTVERSSNVVVCEQDIEVNVIQSKAILAAALFIIQLDI